MTWEGVVRKLATKADIELNGSRPWDITVHNPKLYKRIALHGSLGLGDSYMDGWWDCESLDEFATRILGAHLDKNSFDPTGRFAAFFAQRFMNLQSARRAFIVGEQHYDIGNDLYEAMLDTRMTYTCGYWRNAKTLDQAQEDKLRLICEKLKLKPGIRVLDIGCGWGSFALFAAKEYGVSVVGITVSKEQVALGESLAKDLPVEFRLLDYRDAPKEFGRNFDRIVSVGMFEHVGPKNYDQYFSVADQVLKDDGLFLLHTIGTNDRYSMPDPWIDKHIFPNGILPTLRQVVDAAQDRFIMEDWHNFGTDYDKTLMAWYANIEKAWEKLPSDRYDDRFRRMWRYYLLMCAGAFRSRNIQLWQIVYSRGIRGGYASIR